jgi:hypothetical protein
MVSFIHIFVEGDADVKFISDYITHIKPNTKINLNKGKKANEANVYLDGDMVTTVHGLTGWTDIANMKTAISQYKDSGNVVLVIFDADTDENEGGFVKRQKQLENYALQLDSVFLFPNNQNDGALEDLLENIINPTNKPIFDCWGKYEICLQEYASKQIGKDLTTPAKKSKIYNYLEVLFGKTSEEKKKIKDANRNFKNMEHWNLDSDFLIPLKKFLLKYL